MMGLTQERIANALGVSEDILREHYRHELDTAADMANRAVAGKLYQKAMQGNVPCMIFWLKTRARWREVQHVEMDGELKINITLAKPSKR